MYSTVNELSKYVKDVIDSHWRLETTEEEMISSISEIFLDVHNRELAFRGNSFSATFERKLGVKRTSLLKELLTRIDSKKYRF